SNDDGIGDFKGLMQRLDHVASLGVDAIWVMPFYPSPLRDDGYDISDYETVNPSYGTMRDFRAFVDRAHRRGLRVITELVINHTSDQHPWFQRARRAPPGSPERDFYVWSDTDDRYRETRIIFIDTEKSNWTWDEKAKAYFWHRFYSHQPDLNFDNPAVIVEVKRLLRYWLDMGVDGLRLDAIPYLVERDGTNNENLSETHAVLKELRAEMDKHYPDRMFLAEANQWPEDTRPYFGDGDECHMAFHFPLMPRMYMAVAQEDRHPITDIIRQTPDIPENCQWAIFLRNHDELTLEMVTAEERDYLWRTYAKDKRARINLGIRRRLAPLMDNDRRKIELMNALLFSMPGTPVVYYGDEIGMGDNYFLGDRDGVRTPMQWSADRNGGFSRANPQALYLPAIMDPVYGYQAVNVEAEQGEANSLLNWMRRMIAVRRQHRAFGRGSFTLLYPNNRKILAYVREHGGERILCVFNLSRQAQAVEIDLSPYRGSVPIELSGGAPFPPAGDLPYLLTLPAYGFFWFLLADEAEAPRWRVQAPGPLPEYVTVTAPGGSLRRALADSGERRLLERYALPAFIAGQRWFADKGERIEAVDLESIATIPGEENRLAIVTARTGRGGAQRYLMPLSVLWGEENLRFGAPKLSWTLAKIRTGPKLGAIIDAAYDERFHRDLIAAIRNGRPIEAEGGRVEMTGTNALRTLTLEGPLRNVGVEQSNVSFIVNDLAIVKVYRRLRDGEQPEIAVTRFLTETAGYRNIPAFLGAAEYVPAKGAPLALAAVFAFVRNQGDAWNVMLDALGLDLDTAGLASAESAAPFAHPLDLGGVLGRRTAELHAAFATPTNDRDFKAEPIKPRDVARWVKEATRDVTRALDIIAKALPGLTGEAKADAAALSKARKTLLARVSAAAKLPMSGLKMRIHGDYHLGQVLVAQDDVYLIDFEGEPQRGLAERREKTSPLRDVAGMLRSFDYAAWSALDRMRERTGRIDPVLRDRACAWRDSASREFAGSYLAAAKAAGFLPDSQLTQAFLDLFLIQKAAYEVQYEAANRPAWLSIPIRGLLSIIGRKGGGGG
ncbi:MAG TPA: maltose alpha-D-glucosyltransferase, partial [Bauldia sp.]|nr:maltose alpha-D-glucosyltransferase [Bauldia sp.]